MTAAFVAHDVLPPWLPLDRLLGLLGGLLTVVFGWLGARYAILALRETRDEARAAKDAASSAREASLSTRHALRTADLQRAMLESFSVSRRIREARHLVVARIVLDDWVAAYQRVYGLLKAGQDRLPTRLSQEAMRCLDSARTEVLVARSAAQNSTSWREYDFGVIRLLISNYERAAEALMVAAGDEMSEIHA